MANSYFQSMVAIALSYSIDSLEFGRLLSEKALTLSFLGSKSRLFLTSGHNREVFQRLLAAKVCVDILYLFFYY